MKGGVGPMATHASGRDSYVLCDLAGATYALRSDDIQQLEMISAATPVPNAPAFVDGVVSVRGQVIPAMNLRARFGFPRAEYDLRSRLVVVRAAGRTVGLIVDSAREFADIPADTIKPLPEGVSGLSGRYLRGITHRADRLLLILDVPQLLAYDLATTDSDTMPAPPQAAPAST
jgi:purine-binding chemotaxis protein CheW